MKISNFILKHLKVLILPIIPTTIVLTSCNKDYLKEFIAKLEKEDNLQSIKTFKLTNSSEQYLVYCHNNSLEKLMHDSYKTNGYINGIYQNTAMVRNVETFSNNFGTFIKASDNATGETNYNQIWVRDSVWGYKKLINDNDNNSKAKAKKVLLSLLDYYSTPKQINRLKTAISNPYLVLSNKQGNMNAVHIRFDAFTLDDVQIDGKDELWNHKQNDALGFLLSELIIAIDNKNITFDDLNQANGAIANSTKRIDTIVYLFAYLNALNYYQMPDSGAWEENEAVRTSSIGLVTNAEERLYEYMNNSTTDTDRNCFIEAYNLLMLNNNYQNYCSLEVLPRYISEGYKTIKILIDNGGECTGYDKSNENYREADAALLNLIYPCSLNNLDNSYKLKILEIINDSLVSPVGIKRYLNDTYQSANFWFNNIKTNVNEGETAKKREKSFIPNTEASWFFDSWYAICCLKEFNDPNTTSQQKNNLEDSLYKFLNRSIGQISQVDNYIANGKKIETVSFPESYNIIYKNKNEYWYIASVIDNLNWAKSTFSILLESLLQNALPI